MSHLKLLIITVFIL